MEPASTLHSLGPESFGPVEGGLAFKLPRANGSDFSLSKASRLTPPCAGQTWENPERIWTDRLLTS